MKTLKKQIKYLLVLSFFVCNVVHAEDVNKIYAPDIIAKNAVVYDVSNREFIYSKKGEESVPLASLVKVITAYTFFNINAMRTELDNPIESITIVKKDYGYNKGDYELVNGDKWNSNDLIRYMLITSSNVAAQSIAYSITDDEFVFSLLMNKYVRDLNFRSFKFKNSTGLSLKGKASAYGSPKEVAVLFDTIFSKLPFIADSGTIPDAKLNDHIVKNTNLSLSTIPNIIAGKTGTTDESGGNLMIVLNVKNNKYVLVILGSTIEERYNDMAKLASSTEAFATLK